MHTRTLITVIAVAAVLIAGVAIADNGTDHYTFCLTKKGELTHGAPGDTPLKECKTNATQIRVASGEAFAELKARHSELTNQLDALESRVVALEALVAVTTTTTTTTTLPPTTTTTTTTTTTIPDPPPDP